MPVKKLSIIVKPTHDCNLGCRYCYVSEEAEKGSMDSRGLSVSTERVADFAQSSHWIWHGGEPLLMGVDFFREVKNVQEHYAKQKGVRFSNGIQTNGTLVTDKVLDFIEESGDFRLGMSMDGPQYLHDKTRVFRDGAGSFEEVLRGIRLTEERNKKLGKNKKNLGGGVICVVNGENVKNPLELYEFFKGERIDVKFNPLIQSGRARSNFEELGITPKQYGEFLTTLWEIYNRDVAKDREVVISVDPFINVLGNLATGKPLGCNYSSSCRDNFISIGPLGDIYPCGRFDGIREFWLGNVNTHSIEEAMGSKTNERLKQRGLESVSGCNSCDYGKVCNTGCMHNAYCAGNINGKDPYCASYKALFNKMQEVLDEEEALEQCLNK